MSKSKQPTDDNAEPRYIPPGSCSWCGHKPHTGACSSTIRLGKGREGDCPCARRAL